MEDLLNQLLAWAETHGTWSGVALMAGMVVGPKAIPVLRRIVSKTPTKLDDMAVDAIALAMENRSPALDHLTAAELEKFITTPVLCELVRLRKARIAEQRKAGT